MAVWDKYFSKQVKQSLIELREHLHKYPELSFAERKTAQRLYDELAKLKPDELEFVANTGVYARFYGKNRKIPPIALRGDIDALPIQEENDIPFKSVNDGVMHACGHDIHASWIIGAAHLLKKKPPPGDVILILQPAEEIGQGAKKIMESKVLDGVGAIFGGHVDRNFKLGEVVVHPGAVSASSDQFCIKMTGKGAHGARPHEGTDVILGLGVLIQSLNTITARRTNPDDAAVISIGRVDAGETHNVIPEYAELEGTIRTLSPQVRKTIHKAVKEISEGIGRAFQLDESIEIRTGMPPIINQSPYIDWVGEAVTNTLGLDGLAVLRKSNMGAEDFAYYLQEIPGAFIRVGARLPGDNPTAAHTPKFLPETETLFVGAVVFAELARIASQNLAK